MHIQEILLPTFTIVLHLYINELFHLAYCGSIEQLGSFINSFNVTTLIHCYTHVQENQHQMRAIKYVYAKKEQ
jgi:hypothetical protein